MGVVTTIWGVVWIGFSFVAMVSEAIPEKLEPMQSSLCKVDGDKSDDSAVYLAHVMLLYLLWFPILDSPYTEALGI